MAFDDKDFGTIFPTRTGPSTGTANERQMLDHLGGSDSFRKTYRTLADGTKVRCDTNNGMPRFIATPPETPPDLKNPYMESGCLTWSFPAPENTTRTDPAKWRFCDIPTDGKWLGEVLSYKKPYGKQVKRQPTPADTGVLRDNINSLAIGAVAHSDPADAITVAKKVVCGYFPASFFSGRMRLFMQAQYGARQPTGQFYFSADVSGMSPTLLYTPPYGETIQFGFWPHMTTGMFTLGDFRYYLVQVMQNKGGVIVYGYPLRLSAAGKRIRSALLAGEIEANGTEDQRKIEAYLLAEAVIETSKQFIIGTYAPGDIGGSYGSALAWGWKFNGQGDRVSIVRTAVVGDYETRTLDGRAQEVHLNIARSPVQDGTEAGKWTLSGEAGPVYNWQDGWGLFNIFTPETETSSTLAHYSILRGWGAVAEYSFDGAPIYGFYDRGNVWRTVRLSRLADNTGAEYEQEQTGMVVRTDYANLSGVSEYKNTGNTALDYDSDTVSKRKSNAPATYEKRTVAAGSHKRFQVSAGDWSYTGWRKTGTYRRSEYSAPVDSDVALDVLTMPSPFTGAAIPMPGIPEFQAIDDYIALYGGLWGNFRQYSGLDNYFKTDIYGGKFERIDEEGSFDKIHQWTVVIPCGDCNAVHIATRELETYMPAEKTKFTADSQYRYNVTLWRMLNPPYASPSIEVDFELPYRHMSTQMGWAAIGSLGWTDYVTLNVVNVVAVTHHLGAEPGVPSTGYGTLFTVDLNWPFFNGTMWYGASAGEEYIGSEGYNSGVINANFVGWF